MSLKIRFILIYGAGSIFVLTMITLFVFSSMETEMVNQLRHQFELNAEKKIYSLNRTLDDLSDEYQSIASIPMFRSMRYHQLILNEAALRDDIRQLELYLLKFQQQHEEVENIKFIDNKGIEVIHVRNKMISRNLADFSQDPDVKSALSLGKNDLFVAANRQNNRLEEIVWWFPVFISNDIRLGVIGVHISYEYIDELIQNMSEESVWVCFRDQENRLIRTSGKLHHCVGDNPGLWKTRHDFNLPGYKWTIEYLADSNIYLNEVKQLRKYVYGIILPGFAVLAFIGIFLTSRKITTAIEYLVTATRSLGREETYVPVDIDRNDELGVLAQEINRTARHIQQKTSSLIESNEELESYSYSIAHDLRTPLRTISGFSELLKSRAHDRLEAGERDKLDRIILATHKMSSLIDDILQLSRITRQDLKQESVNLTELAENIFQDLHSIDSDRQLSWQVEKNMVITGDPQLFQVLLENLIGNAWKYTQKLQHAEIKFESRLENNRKLYYIKDNGVGFDMRYVDKLFRPFERLHSSAEFEGTGIGLATVKRIINKHHGNVWVDSKTGQGTTIFFEVE